MVIHLVQAGSTRQRSAWNRPQVHREGRQTEEQTRYAEPSFQMLPWQFPDNLTPLHVERLDRVDRAIVRTLRQRIWREQWKPCSLSFQTFLGGRMYPLLRYWQPRALWNLSRKSVGRGNQTVESILRRHPNSKADRHHHRDDVHRFLALPQLSQRESVQYFGTIVQMIRVRPPYRCDLTETRKMKDHFGGAESIPTKNEPMNSC